MSTNVMSLAVYPNFSTTPRPRTTTLFPYTTLFRSAPTQATAKWLALLSILNDADPARLDRRRDRKSTRLNSSHEWTSYAVFCLKKKNRKLMTKNDTP